MKRLKHRARSKTPKFWKKVQKVGLLAAGIATVIATAPVSLPAAIVSVGGYLAVAGGTVAVLSQFTMEHDD